MMTDKQQPPQNPPTIDPDNVPEILCDGQFNVSVAGQFATLTFTHVRPDATTLFGTSTFDLKSIVRARIVVSLANLGALRDLLNLMLQSPQPPARSAGGSTRH